MNVERGEINTGLERRTLSGAKSVVETIGNQRIRVIQENPEVAEEVLWMSELFEGDNRVRVGRVGKIYIASYRTAEDQEITDPTLPIPSSKKVKKRWSMYPDIPTARLATRAITRTYEAPEGHEYRQLRSVSEFVRFGIRELQNRSVRTEEDLKALKELAVETLSEGGFGTVVKPEKLKLRDKIMTAVQPVDTKGRFNPSRTRMLLNRVLLDTIPLFLFEDAARDKFGNLYDKLTLQEEMERFYLQEGHRLIKQFADAKPRSNEYADRAWNLREYMKTFMADERIRTAPYRRAAIISRLIFTGAQTGFEKVVLDELGIKNDELFPIRSERDFDKYAGRNRMLLLGRGMHAIEQALIEGEQKFNGTWVEPDEPPKRNPNEDPFARFERGKRIDN